MTVGRANRVASGAASLSAQGGCAEVRERIRQRWERAQKNRRDESRRFRKRKFPKDQETWPETSLVISNIETDFLPLKISFILSSALIWVRTFLSCRPFFLM